MVGDVRGIGLLNCMNLVSNKETKEPAPKQLCVRLEELTRDRGLLVRVNPARAMLWGNAAPDNRGSPRRSSRRYAARVPAIVQDEMRASSS